MEVGDKVLIYDDYGNVREAKILVKFTTGFVKVRYRIFGIIPMVKIMKSSMIISNINKGGYKNGK